MRIVDIKRKRTVMLNDFTDTSLDLTDFNEDLFDCNDRDTEWDIVEVYRPTTKETFTTERTKETKKMTVAEICKKLGYDVEIITDRFKIGDKVKVINLIGGYGTIKKIDNGKHYIIFDNGLFTNCWYRFDQLTKLKEDK